MTLVDLVYKVLDTLYKRDGISQKYYPAFEVWSYLIEEKKEDLHKLGYNWMTFTHFDMDCEVLTLLGDNNGNPFRAHKEDADDGSEFCKYWIP